MTTRMYLMHCHIAAKRNSFQPSRATNHEKRVPILSVVSGGSVVILGVFLLLYVMHKSHENREQNWDSAIATVIDTRTHLFSEQSGISGGRMLYKIQVLAAYTAGGSPQERWITVDREPATLEDAEFQGRLLRGKQYSIRWNPADANEIDIDVHEP
jgi:hypothetical protein